MGDRKVINHYVPPDFDPKLLPRTKRDLSKPSDVRTMIPFSMRCNMCHEYMYQGKKFNCKMEVLQDETYLGIRIRRFYIKCTNCSGAITYKTDPKNSGYELESGASRNFESWREKESAEAEAKATRLEEDELDAMKKLENRTLDNKREMDAMDALEELRAKNLRNEHSRLDTAMLVASLDGKHPKLPSAKEIPGADGLTDSERHMLTEARLKFNSRPECGGGAGGTGHAVIRALPDSDSDNDDRDQQDKDKHADGTSSERTKVNREKKGAVHDAFDIFGGHPGGSQGVVTTTNNLGLGLGLGATSSVVVVKSGSVFNATSEIGVVLVSKKRKLGETTDSVIAAASPLSASSMTGAEAPRGPPAPAVGAGLMGLSAYGSDSD